MSESAFCHPAWTGAVHAIVPVVPTPFDEHERVDFESLEGLIDFAADAGVTGLCLPAYGSEFYKLSESESAELVRAAVRFANVHMNVVVAQSNHFSSKLAAQTAQQNQDAGAEIISFALPCMFSLGGDDLLRYAARVAKSGHCPGAGARFQPGGSHGGGDLRPAAA